jgi:hypothetical protein
MLLRWSEETRSFASRKVAIDLHSVRAGSRARQGLLIRHFSRKSSSSQTLYLVLLLLMLILLFFLLLILSSGLSFHFSTRLKDWTPESESIPNPFHRLSSSAGETQVSILKYLLHHSSTNRTFVYHLGHNGGFSSQRVLVSELQMSIQKVVVLGVRVPRVPGHTTVLVLKVE